RVHLSASESQELSFEIAADDLKLVDENGENKLIKGEYELVVGNASPGQRSETLGAVFSSALFKIQ
ncbi:MAG: fibronectin type III-like domain-contianing protein, partial [Prolixibacteraceae bacterium]